MEFGLRFAQEGGGEGREWESERPRRKNGLSAPARDKIWIICYNSRVCRARVFLAFHKNTRTVVVSEGEAKVRTRFNRNAETRAQCGGILIIRVTREVSIDRRVKMSERK